MKNKGIFKVTILSVLGLFLIQAQASELEIPNTFQDGQVTSASEMNANFEAIKAAVNDNNSRIDAPRSQFVGFSSTTLDGAGGIFAMQQACHSFSSNTHICDTSEVNGSVYSESAMASIEEGDEAWIRVKLAGGQNEYGGGIAEDSSIAYGGGNAQFAAGNMTNCEGWKNNQTSGYVYGATIKDTGGLGYRRCSVSLKVACCK